MAAVGLRGHVANEVEPARLIVRARRAVRRAARLTARVRARAIADTRVVHEVQVIDRGRERRRSIALGVGGAGVVSLATGLYFFHDRSYLQRARETVCIGACTWADVSDRAADSTGAAGAPR